MLYSYNSHLLKLTNSPDCYLWIKSQRSCKTNFSFKTLYHILSKSSTHQTEPRSISSVKSPGFTYFHYLLTQCPHILSHFLNSLLWHSPLAFASKHGSYGLISQQLRHASSHLSANSGSSHLPFALPLLQKLAEDLFKQASIVRIRTMVVITTFNILRAVF